MARIKKDDLDKTKITKPIKPSKLINISSKIAMQNSGVLFEINETHSFNEGDYSLDEINDIKIQLLTNNLISLNNFQKQIEGNNG